MAFPEFDPERRKLLFFVRGRGRGHAAPSLAIADALTRLRSDVEIRFVSYGTGAATIRQHQGALIDLQLPEHGSLADMTYLAGKLIGWLDPDLIVSHEEFAIPPVAKIFSKPAVVLTDWFADSDFYSTSSFRYAEEVLFLGAVDSFREPSSAKGKVRYLGAMIRDFKYTIADRARARQELGLPGGAKVIAVFPGSWREEVAPVADSVLHAFDTLTCATKRLLWLAGVDEEVVAARVNRRDDVLVLNYTSDIDRLMVAADLAITKTNRKTVFELRALNIPTIAISYGLNPPDDVAVAGLSGVIRLDGSRFNAIELQAAIADLLGTAPPPDTFPRCTASDCATLLSAALDRATSSRQ